VACHGDGIHESPGLALERRAFLSKVSQTGTLALKFSEALLKFLLEADQNVFDHLGIPEPLFQGRHKLFLQAILPDRHGVAADATVAMTWTTVTNVSPFALAAYDDQPGSADPAEEQSAEQIRAASGCAVHAAQPCGT
jgi:hypothetical protein